VKPDERKLILSTSPYVKRPVDTPAIMRHVIYALLPVIGAAVYFFGVNALLLIATCSVTAVLTEWVLGGRRKLGESTITDGSALVTGLLLALTLPPGLPLWMAGVGAVAAMVLGKAIFGGLGYNVFNPSLTGRAFLQACFPVALTTWVPHGGFDRFLSVHGGTLTLPFATANVDAVSSATPLARMKFESIPTAVSDLLVGSIPGSLGETSAVLILLGGAYLAVRRFLNWRIPVGIFATVFALATVLHWINPARFPGGAFHLLSGGLMLGAVFMATDPVTSPVTPRGAWIFAFGIGLLVIVIRQFGGLPEGVMYAILLMNGLSPIIDRYTQPRIYGTRISDKGPVAGSAG
jgi:electron transport complex protein RnfD